MEEVLKLIEGYGLSLVLLLGCLYALYRFFWFSVREVKDTFVKKHEKTTEVLEELDRKITLLIELFKGK